MNKKLIFLVISFLYMVTATAQPLLIPYPRSIEMREGYFALTAKTGIINLSDKNNARLLKHYIEEDININLHEQRGDNNIFLITNRKLKESLGAEGYRMNISADSIVIEGAENAGVFYGIQTLRQLAAQNRLAIPCMEIFDKPEYEWRDFMLDEARHFKGKVVVKQLLEEMAYLKMNKFHWHLTDDQGWRIEIEKYPRLTQIGAYRDSTQIGGWNSPLYDVNIHGGYYTREDIREIVDFAAERHIEIVPEIEMPGHSRLSRARFLENTPYRGHIFQPHVGSIQRGRRACNTIHTRCFRRNFRLVSKSLHTHRRRRSPPRIVGSQQRHQPLHGRKESRQL